MLVRDGHAETLGYVSQDVELLLLGTRQEHRARLGPRLVAFHFKTRSAKIGDETEQIFSRRRECAPRWSRVDCYCARGKLLGASVPTLSGFTDRCQCGRVNGQVPAARQCPEDLDTRCHSVTIWTTMKPQCAVNRAKNQPFKRATRSLSGRNPRSAERILRLSWLGSCAKGEVGWRSTPWLDLWFLAQFSVLSEAHVCSGWLQDELNLWENIVTFLRHESVKGYQAIDARVREILPSQIRGVLLWRSAGITANERASLSAALTGDWTLERVCRLLKGTWSDGAYTDMEWSREASREDFRGVPSRREVGARARGVLWNRRKCALGHNEEQDHDEILALEDCGGSRGATCRRPTARGQQRVSSWTTTRKHRGVASGRLSGRHSVWQIQGKKEVVGHQTGTRGPGRATPPRLSRQHGPAEHGWRVETATDQARTQVPAATDTSVVSCPVHRTRRWTAQEEPEANGHGVGGRTGRSSATGDRLCWEWRRVWTRRLSSSLGSLLCYGRLEEKRQRGQRSHQGPWVACSLWCTCKKRLGTIIGDASDHSLSS